MRININKDFLTEYKDDFWKGFSLSEVIHIGLGFGVGIVFAVGLVLFFSVPIPAATYLVTFVALPFIFAEFYKYQGYLRPVLLLKEMLYTARCKDLIYEAGEYDKHLAKQCRFHSKKVIKEKRKRRWWNGITKCK